MNYENYFKDMFESVLDYRKKVLFKFSTRNHMDLLKECGFEKKMLII